MLMFSRLLMIKRSEILGFQINDDTGEITYTDDAVGMTPMSITDGVFNPGSWGGRWVADIKPCLLQSLVPNYYLKKTDEFAIDYSKQENDSASDITSGNDGDVMNEIQLSYYKFWEETVGGTLYKHFQVSRELPDSSYCANAFLSRDNVVQSKIFLPAYDGVVLNNKLRSLSGTPPTVNHTIGEFRTYANANGIGYEQFDQTKWGFLTNLMILFFKGFDSQTLIGKGVTDASAAINTGTMNDKPLFCGDQTGTNGMKFMGIENFYGNIFKFLDGVGYLASNNFGYKIVPPYNDDRTGYEDSGVAIPTTGWINRMSRANGYGMLPSATVAAEADSRYKDYIDTLSGNYPITSWGGFWGLGSNAGAFAWYGSSASTPYAIMGASLFATPQG